MGGQIKTQFDTALLVANALDAYRKQYPLLGEEIEEIQSAGPVPRIRLKLGTGETFVIDTTREPRPRANRDSL